MSISQRTQAKRDRFRDRSLMKLLETHHYMYCFSTLRQGLLCCSEVITQSVALMSVRTQRGSFPTWRVVLCADEEERLERAPVVSWIPIMGN